MVEVKGVINLPEHLRVNLLIQNDPPAAVMPGKKSHARIRPLHPATKKFIPHESPPHALTGNSLWKSVKKNTKKNTV
jgi:hypothetical protein